MEKHLREKKKAAQDLEGQIIDMEQELMQSYCDLGKSVLDIAEAEGRKTNALVDQIIRKKKRLMDMRGETQCDACGLYSEADSRYCRHCGNKIVKGANHE